MQETQQQRRPNPHQKEHRVPRRRRRLPFSSSAGAHLQRLAADYEKCSQNSEYAWPQQSLQIPIPAPANSQNRRFGPRPKRSERDFSRREH